MTAGTFWLNLCCLSVDQKVLWYFCVPWCCLKKVLRSKLVKGGQGKLIKVLDIVIKPKYESFHGFQSKGLNNIQRIKLFYLSLEQSMRKRM